MAPEVYLKQPQDEKTDVFAFASMMFFMLTEKRLVDKKDKRDGLDASEKGLLLSSEVTEETIALLHRSLLNQDSRPTMTEIIKHLQDLTEKYK